MDETNADNADDSDVTEFVRVNVAVEMPLDIVLSTPCNKEVWVDSDADTDATSLIRAVTLDALNVSVSEIAEYIAGPASSAAEISNSVSREEGAAPTSDVNAFNT